MRLASAVFAGLVLATSIASALPPIPPYLRESLADKPEYKAYSDLVQGSKDKCASCHKPGADKKAKGHGLNDFGEAMHKHLDHKAFMAAHKAKKAEDALKLLSEAFGKAIEEKNAKGEKFADLIKAGKLPGTAE